RRHTRCYRDWSSDVCSSDLFKRYVEALVQKPAAEINVESNIEPPESEDGDKTRKEESMLDIMMGQKPPEPPPEPPPPTEEEDERSEERRVGNEWKTQKTQQR